MPLPNSMRHITLTSHGAADVMHIVSSPLPMVGAVDVLIRVAYAGVNRPDVAQRQGSYAPPPGASPIMGLEVAGEVVAAGESVTRWKIGDLVCALTPGGGYAEYCVAPAAHCLPIPQGMSMLGPCGRSSVAGMPPVSRCRTSGRSRGNCAWTGRTGFSFRSTPRPVRSSRTEGTVTARSAMRTGS